MAGESICRLLYGLGVFLDEDFAMRNRMLGMEWGCEAGDLLQSRR